MGSLCQSFPLRLSLGVKEAIKVPSCHRKHRKQRKHRKHIENIHTRFVWGTDEMRWHNMWEGVDGADSGIGLLDASCCQGNGVDSSGSMYSRENM